MPKKLRTQYIHEIFLNYKAFLLALFSTLFFITYILIPIHFVVGGWDMPVTLPILFMTIAALIFSREKALRGISLAAAVYLITVLIILGSLHCPTSPADCGVGEGFVLILLLAFLIIVVPILAFLARKFFPINSVSKS